MGITIDGRVINAKVKKISGVFNNFSVRSTAQFELKLNRIASRSDVNDEDFPYSFSVLGDKDTLSVACYVYMDESDGQKILTNLSVDLTELVIETSDAQEHSVLGETVPTYSFGTILLQKGKYFNGRINLLTGFALDNLVWAYGNLYYDTNGPNYKYKIRNDPSEGYQALSTDYWAWNGDFPGKESVRDQFDPCTKVYPEGRWRMPTEAEAKDLYRNSSLDKSSYYGKNENKISYVQFTHQDRGNSIRFYAHGYYHTKDNFTGGETTSYYANFWLSTGGVSLKDGLQFTVSSLGYTDATPNYTYVGHRMNVRCVRELRR